MAAMSRIAVAQETPSTQPAESTATTQPIQPTPPQSIAQIQKSFDDLASTEPQVREAARMELLGLSRDQLPALREIVRTSNPLAPAQAAALHDIVVHVFLAGEPYDGQGLGFMGVMLPRERPDLIAIAGGDIAGGDDNDPDTGVLVQDCMPGFCGFRYLRPGDVITAMQIAGQAGQGEQGGQNVFMRTTSQLGLITEISKHAPGSPLKLRLVRQGRLIDVTIVLSERPKIADVFDQTGVTVDQWRNERMQLAREYWETVFLPLLGGNVS
jgi:hypothetical protein